MPIVIFAICILLLLFKGKSTSPSKDFSNDPEATDNNSITVDAISAGIGNAPKPITNANGTITIKATITAAKAKTIANQLIDEWSDYLTQDSDIMNIILQCKNDADYALVFSAFGEHGQMLFTGALADGFGTKGPFDLTQWMTFTINDDYDKRRLHKRFPTVF